MNVHLFPYVDFRVLFLDVAAEWLPLGTPGQCLNDYHNFLACKGRYIK